MSHRPPSLTTTQAAQALERQRLSLVRSQSVLEDLGPVDMPGLDFSVQRITATNGSSTLSFPSPPPAAQIGSTIILAGGGDSAPNHLVSLTQLHMPFQGTSGTFTATLYGDGLALPAGFEQLTSPVTCALPGGLVFQLQPWADIQPLLRPNAWIFPTWAFGSQPTHYKLVTGQTLDGLPPFYVMRLYPAPAQAFRLEFDYTGQARPWSISDLVIKRELDLRDYAWAYLRPMMLAKLLGTGLLKDSVSADLLMQQAARAEKAIAATPTAGTGSPNKIRTAAGW
ncbi:MAG: hypothetical protein JWO94_258 [Verrucomicrobiaceae bacterium]|nr:hypothetical protein [Verrucomicrobiaceae bacterium]